ncbi:flagellar hook-associated protein 1 [Clostridia bacterium]|nr:flagellar hook-associated protein 1 [Clostridia bacterium]
MRSTFYGLSIVQSGLLVSQRQLDVMGHNIANANTEGYSRQRYITEANPPPGYNQQFAPIDKGQVGQGVQTLSLDQIRDRFLDRQFRQENTKNAYWETRSKALYYVEDVFNGDQDSSLSGIIGTFFNAVQELSKNPTDEAIRTNLSQETKKMTDVFHTYHSQMQDLMYQQDYAMAQQVNVVNEYTVQIASLNDNILKYEQGGQVANDLRDQRNLLLDKLSALVDISYQEVGTGKYNINGRELTKLQVNIGATNEPLIDHLEYRLLVAEQDESNDITDAMDQPLPTEQLLHSIRFEDTGEILELSSGEIKGYMDVRDGNEKENQGLPYFVARLDELAKAMVEVFNDVHMQGYTVPYTDSNGVFHESTTGVPFFDVTGLTAAKITLSDEVIASGFNIAASDEPVTKDADGHFNTGNNLIALRLIKDVKERNDIDVIGSFEGYFKGYISEMAAEVGHANQMSKAELVLVDSLQAQRLSVMGVSIDEEMTDMIRFQHAYNAAARSITAMDEMLEMLILRTGRVGL